jgi:hypothetical protein
MVEVPKILGMSGLLPHIMYTIIGGGSYRSTFSKMR